MARRMPTLLRVSHLIGAIGTAIIIVLVVLLALAAYSASQLSGQQPTGSSGSSVTLPGNGTVALSNDFNLTNPGYFAISDLTVAALISAVNGTRIGEGGSAPVTIAAHTQGQVPLTLWVPLGGSTSYLAVRDANLSTEIWVNASYAGLFLIHLSIVHSYSWGAPFDGFNATPLPPTVEPNGTVLVPVQISFQNHASFADVGTISFTVRAPGGASCGSGSWAVNAPAGAGFNQVESFYASPGCNPSGGTIVSSYTGNGLTVALPTESIP